MQEDRKNMFRFSSQHLLSQLGKGPSYSSGCLHVFNSLKGHSVKTPIWNPLACFRAPSLQIDQTFRPNVFTYSSAVDRCISESFINLYFSSMFGGPGSCWQNCESSPVYEKFLLYCDNWFASLHFFFFLFILYYIIFTGKLMSILYMLC